MLDAPLHNLPALAVPAGLGTYNACVESYGYGSYTSMTYSGRPTLASDGDAMPVIGAKNMEPFHFPFAENPSFTPIDPLPSPGFGKTSPYWGVQNFLIQMPRELILVADPTIFDAFITAHLSDLVAAGIYINSSASSRASSAPSWGNSDLTDSTFGYSDGMWPNILHYVPVSGVSSINIEQSKADFGGGSGTNIVARNVGTTDANSFIGGQRLVIAAIDMALPLRSLAQGSYAVYFQTGSGGDNTYGSRSALVAAHQARAIQTDAYFDKIQRTYYLFWADNTLASPATSFIGDFTALCNAVGNCTIVNKGNTTLAGAMSVANIWSEVQLFFGI